MARNQWGPISEWMPFFGVRFYASPYVAKMRDFQKEWYKALLWQEWLRGGYLADDPGQLWVLAGADSKEYFEKHCAIVIERFEKSGDGRLYNADLLDIYQQQADGYEKRSKAGKLARAVLTNRQQASTNGDESSTNRDHISLSNSTSEVLSVSEILKAKPVKAAFELETFAGDELFEELCQSFPKATRDPLTMNEFLQAVEREAQRQTLNRQDAAAWIIGRAKRYRELSKFQQKLRNWLYERTYRQSDKAWVEPETKKPSVMDKLYGNDK